MDSTPNAAMRLNLITYGTIHRAIAGAEDHPGSVLLTHLPGYTADIAADVASMSQSAAAAIARARQLAPDMSLGVDGYKATAERQRRTAAQDADNLAAHAETLAAGLRMLADRLRAIRVTPTASSDGRGEDPVDDSL